MNSGKTTIFATQSQREVSEWLKELPWKGSIRATVSRVRIPSSLHQPETRYYSGFFLYQSRYLWKIWDQHQKLWIIKKI